MVSGCLTLVSKPNLFNFVIIGPSKKRLKQNVTVKKNSKELDKRLKYLTNEM